MKHYFNVTVASDVGVNAAIVFENLSFWITHNAKTGRNEREGSHWMYATQKDIADQFDYLTLKQTRTALEKLVQNGYIKTDSFNRHGYDRTIWYGLTDKGNSILHNEKKDLPSKANAEPQGAKVIDLKGETIPDVKEDDKKIDIEAYKARIRKLAAECGSVCTI